MVSDQSERVPQDIVAGKYRLTRMIGRGGMGSVWEGLHTSLGARVAIKFIEAEYVDSDEARQRFENEARAAAMLRSKHVVQVHDHGVMPDGRPYIVMEFLAGEPLDRRLDRIGRLAPPDTVRILVQVCRALAKAHEVGIVHRDLKPENVFLVWDEEDGEDIAKVVDFGIAKFTGASMGVSSSTRTGSVLGTPYYMSPEQARGLRSVDYRSDLWSVGVIAYRCMVGHLPFEGEAVGDLLVKICTAPLPVPSQQASGVPPHFDAWFQRALAREPGERFASAMELAEALATSCGVSMRGLAPASSYDAAGSGAAVAGPYRAVAMTPGVPGSGYSAPTGRATQPSAGSLGATTPASGLHGDPAALTAGPTTQTPNIPTKKTPAGALVAASIGALNVLGGAAVHAAKLFGGAPTEPDAQVGSVEPIAAQAPDTAPIEVAPAEPQPPAPPAAVSAKPPEPVSESKPLEPRPKPQAKPVVRPAAKPAPKPGPKPVKPEAKPKEIDIGY
jgi:tRNA A-37 threonylcarbamoyl transferase component Bud32